FSSRRRHTRSKRDWSSDVCSSDLLGPDEGLAALAEADGPLSVARLETLVGTKRSRLNLLLKTLEVEDAVSKVKGGYVSTGLGWKIGRASCRERGWMGERGG